MRFCRNDKPQVYEATGENLPDLLRDTASELDKMDGSYTLVSTAYDSEAGYIVTAYVH